MNPPPELKSLVENDGIFISVALLATLAVMYTNEGDKKNPLAWPYYATEADLKDMPPMVISCNECDPLRDEGLEFGKKCAEFGLNVTTKTIKGTCHAGDSIVYDKCVPDICLQTARDISQFAIYNDECPYEMEGVANTAKL